MKPESSYGVYTYGTVYIDRPYRTYGYDRLRTVPYVCRTYEPYRGRK